MAQENIPLVITLGGVDKAVTSVRQFAQAIKEAQNRLLLIGDEGSVEFQQLDKDIQKARNQLQEFKEDANQTKVQRGLKDFIEVGSSITAVFVGAQAALQAFGVESEAAGKASATVQNLLTLAITAQTIAQNKNALAKVANTVVTIGQTAATQGLIAATRLLWTTMLANPITAIVVLIGALASAYLLLKDDTDEAAAAQERYKNALDDTTSSNERQLALLQAQGKDEITIQKGRIQAAEELAQIQEAEFVRLNTINRFSKETAAQRKLVIEAQAKVEVEQATLVRLQQEKTKKSSDDLEQTRKKNFDNEKSRMMSLIQLRLDELKSIEAVQKQVAKLTKDESQIEEQLKKNVATAEQYAKALDSLKTFGMEYSELQGTLIEQSDDFYTVFDQLRLGAEGYFDILSTGKVDVKNVQNAFSDFRKTILETNKTILSPQELQLLTDYSQGYSTLYGVLSEYQKPPFDLKEYEELLVNLSIAQGKIDVDPFGRTPEDIGKVKVNINEYFKEVETEFLDAYEKLKLPSILEGVTDPEAQKKAAEGIRETGKAVFQNLVEAGQQILIFEEGSEATNLSVQKLNEQLLKLADTAREGFIVQNIDKLKDQFNIPLSSVEKNREMLLDLENEINTKRFDQQNKYYTDVEFLEYELAQQGIDISKFSYESKLMILKQFLEKEIIAVETAEDKKRKAQQETISGITASIQAFQSVLNSLAQTTSQYYAFQLDLLAKNSEEIQKKIVGDSEEAVQLRLEQEQIYNEKKKQLEKQSAVTALRISLAQSIANVAESITRAFTAGPVIGQIAAGIIAGIGVAQTALIGAQLSQIQSLQRGGIIKGQGGLVVGPSHEYGGVKFQGGGIELEGGEAVINRQSAVRYGSLLSSVNQLGGGRPLVSNNFDDSRIVEAIAKQRSEPIRAYVVEQDITSKQGVTRRLEQLSQI